MNPRFDRHRRALLKGSVQTLAASGLLATLGTFQRALAAADTSGYKALVNVFLLGGNDAFNWLVPRDNAHYATYANTRSVLALPQSSLLAITPGNLSGGLQLGLHPSCSGIRSLHEAGKAAFVANLGPLVQPTTAAQFKAQSAPLPPSLFSHNDQQNLWMTSTADSLKRIGWAGRVADLLQDQGYNPRLAVNISVNGNNIWQSANRTVPYALGLDGAPTLTLATDTGANGGRRAATFKKLLALSGNDPNLLQQEFGATTQRALDSAQFVNDALATVPADFKTAFPSTGVGRQLQMVARMVRARGALGVSRQLFFVGFGGWDTHDNQLNDQATQLGQLDAAVAAFQSALAEINAEPLVTTFTASDFGRTAVPNSDGTDHGWGSHALVTGGAVRGRALYGTMPDLTRNSADDTGAGRMAPTLSTDQYAATLAKWFGVAASDLDLLFPNLHNFGSRDLGFLG